MDARRLKGPATTPELLALATAAYFTLLCNFRFWKDVLAIVNLDDLRQLVFLFTLPLVVTALSFLFLLAVAFRRTLKPVLTVLFFANALALYFMDTYHVYIDKGMLRNALQTDWREVAELLDVRMIGYLLLYGVLPTITLQAIHLRATPARGSVTRRLTMAGTALAMVAVSVGLLSRQYMFLGREHRELADLLTPANYIAAGIRLLRGQNRGGDRAARIAIGSDAHPGQPWETRTRPLLLVVVVGETARAQAFSLNGYDRQTNPQLGRHAIFNFSHVSSCGTSTAESLPCMFRPFGRGGPDTDELRQYESLLDVAQRAGVQVTWLDNNSGCKGVCAGVASHQLNNDKDPDLCGKAGCYDEILVKKLGQLLAGKPRSALVVLHQQGSHGPAYFRRYPPGFQRFTPACATETLLGCSREEIRNAYDNTILYTDHVLSELIDLLDAQQDRYDAAMLYVSDHGESLGENGLYLHGLPYRIAPETQTHVPMIYWMSAGFVEDQGVSKSCVQAATASTFSHDNLFASVLGLFDIRTRVYQPERDMFASCRRHTLIAGPAQNLTTGGAFTADQAS
jgi:lipid A ethanolaminephosphotransferase